VLPGAGYYLLFKEIRRKSFLTGHLVENRNLQEIAPSSKNWMIRVDKDLADLALLHLQSVLISCKERG
jgi:hypothetical protein